MKQVSINTYKDIFSKKGFFVEKNFFDKFTIKKILREIQSGKGMVKYYDKKNNIRRIEKVYNKGLYLKNSNNKIQFFLKKIFKKKFTIFKDKYNAKPPKGEGFYAHYDGIFFFPDKNNRLRKGWYEYSNSFINVLIALDSCNKKNGALEIAKKHSGGFNKLIKNTYNDGTPNITKKIEKKCKFELINLNIGDIVIFQNTCPHRSNKNNSNKPRRTLYYTYTNAKKGSQYSKYFIDKKNSKNKTNKSLEGKI
jgi:ectoine hydroxylase-related dioxygenase (phytanoyl-CoA dioxygenase family)